MKKIGLLLSGKPKSGGVFQYNLAMLNAIASFPNDEYEVVIAYVAPSWLRYIRAYSLNSIRLSPLVFVIRRVWFRFRLPDSQGEYVAKLFWPMVARKIRKQKCDLWILPREDELSYRVKIPALTSIHDLMHRYERKFPEVSANGEYERREKNYSKVCKFSKAILVDSTIGKQQVHESYSMPLERIFILPFVPSPFIIRTKKSSNFKKRYQLPKKFIFYPARFWAHKNHIRLVKAIFILKKEIPNIQLLLLGSKEKSYWKVKNLVKNLDLQKNIHFMNFVPNEDLSMFYRLARAMIMPTFFGPTNIPPLEAFALGCPTATSNVYGMSEQVGNAALLFNPESIEEISESIRILWTNDDLCNKLIKNGKKRSREWSYPQFRKKLLEIIKQII